MLYFFFICLLFQIFPLQGLESQVYTSPDGEYSLKLPKDWSLVGSGPRADLIALAPRVSKGDLFRESINITSPTLEIEVLSPVFYTENLKTLREFLEDYDLESEEDVTVNGVQGKKIVFSHTVGIVHLKVMQYIFLIDQVKAYILTFTGDPIDFEKMAPLFEVIADSLTFTPPKSLLKRL